MSDQSTQDNYAGVWDTGLGFGKKSAVIVIDLLQGYTTEYIPEFYTLNPILKMEVFGFRKHQF